VAGGSPASPTAPKASSPSRREVPGWDEFAFAITGLPAAIAAAKSPPATLLNAKGKLLGPKTQTGPIGASIERMFSLVSMVGSAQEPSSAAAAAWRSWPVVRGSSTTASRGALGRPVSLWARSTISAARASIRSAKRMRNLAIRSGGIARRRTADSEAASRASSQSDQLLTG